MAQKDIIVGALIVPIYLIVLLSNWFFYQKFPRERWPMVITATAIWWGPISLLGWMLWSIPAWFVGAQLLCLLSAFLATMSLKFVAYRRQAFAEDETHLSRHQGDMLADVLYSLGRQAEHLKRALADQAEMDGLVNGLRDRQKTLGAAIQQLELYRQIGEQTITDLQGGIPSCYLARKQEAELNIRRSGADRMARKEANGKAGIRANSK